MSFEYVTSSQATNQETPNYYEGSKKQKNVVPTS